MPITLGDTNIASSTGKVGIGSGFTPATGLHAQSSGSEADRSLRLAYDATFYSEIRQLGAGGMGFRNNSVNNLMAIDGSGRVTMPFQPAFRVNASSGHVLASGWQTVLYNSSLTQRGNHYNISNSRFTAPVNGWYQFNAQYTSTSNTDEDGTFSLSLNGSTGDLIGSVSVPANYGSYRGRVVSGCAYVNANDYVVVLRYATTSTTARQSQVYSGWFSGFLIG